jgi:hypothetical protein
VLPHHVCRLACEVLCNLYPNSSSDLIRQQTPQLTKAAPRCDDDEIIEGFSAQCALEVPADSLREAMFFHLVVIVLRFDGVAESSSA